MTDYISREAFIKDARKRFCEDCDRRKGIKNGKMKFCYAIGDAPCRSCWVDDMLTEAEDFPAADVRPIVRGKWIERRTNIGTPNVCYFSSCCGFPSWYGKLNFCPNCGADMRPKEGENVSAD